MEVDVAEMNWQERKNTKINEKNTKLRTQILFYDWFATHHDVNTQPQFLSCHIINFIDHISS